MIRKNFNLLMVVSVLFIFTLSSCSKDEEGTTAFLASTVEQNRVALLEDFTGVRCGYCPAGHDIAKSIAEAKPGKIVIIAVHGGQYAAPTTGWPNYTTLFAGPLIAQAKVGGYPAGTVSRLMGIVLGVTPQVTNGYAMGRGDWSSAVTFVNAQKAPVNIGTSASFNAASRLLTVKVDLYYTADVTGASHINVALLQDKIYGKQTGGTPDPNNYEQNHMLRHLITGQWGDVFTTTGQTKGSKVSKTYTYTVPTDYNGTSAEGGGAVVVNNLKVAVFVTNGQTDVLNAKEVDVK